MKVTINIPDVVIAPIIQMHLETEESVQDSIISAIRVWNRLKIAEQEGNSCGYGDKNRFCQYNTHIDLNTGHNKRIGLDD